MVLVDIPDGINENIVSKVNAVIREGVKQTVEVANAEREK